MNENLHCYICHNELPSEQCNTVGDTTLCPDCLENETVTCEVCGDRIFSDDNAGDDDLTLCRSCYDSNYTSCDCTPYRPQTKGKV